MLVTFKYLATSEEMGAFMGSRCYFLGRGLLRTMKTINASETRALARFVESVLQSFAVGSGANQSGPALVAALEPGAVDPAISKSYLKLWKTTRT